MEQRERLAAQLQKFGEAMLQMQARQESAVSKLAEQALEVQKRLASLSEHMERFRALGAKASEIGQGLRDLGANSISHSNGATPSLTPLDIEAHFRQLLDEAKALLESARAQDFTDVASETYALQQRLHALRPRLDDILRTQSGEKS